MEIHAQKRIQIQSTLFASLLILLQCASQSSIGQVAIATADPELVWRTDGPLLAPNTFGKYRNAFSPDGRFVGVVRQPNEAWVLDSSDGSMVRELPYSTDLPGTYSLAFSSSNLMGIGRSQHVEIFDAGRSVRLISCEGCLAIDSVAISPDESLVAFQSSYAPISDEGFGVTIADIATGQTVRLFDALSNRPKVSFSSDGRFLLASAITELSQGSLLGFRVWNIDAWNETLNVPGEQGTKLGIMATGATDESAFVAVYGKDGALEMRDLLTDRVMWTTSLIPPIFAPAESTILGTELSRVEIAPNGKFIVSYEDPIAHDPIGHVSGGIVVRSAQDGSVVAIYDVYGVTGLSIAPDSEAFVYSTGAGQVHTALVRVPPIQ